MAELVFFCGTMDCGKSTLALQMDHNHAAAGRSGLLFSCHDRAGEAVVSSRLGLRGEAIEVLPGLDFWDAVVTRRMSGHRVDYLICDEAQFYTADHVDQLARVTDEMGVDVFAFGITADFRTRLFPGSQRLLELADRVQVLQVEALCWCGARATHNARTVGGVMVVVGDQVVVGDVVVGDRAVRDVAVRDVAVGDVAVRDVVVGEVVVTDVDAPAVGYEVLCRRHHMRRMTRAAARAAASSPDVLPMDGGTDLDVCPLPPR